MRRLDRSRRSGSFRSRGFRRPAGRAILCSLIVLVPAGLVWTAPWFVDRIPIDLFRIQVIRIVGASGDQEAEVRGMIEKKPATSLFKLDLGEIREALMQLRWVKEVRLRKEWPDALLIKIAERVPLAWVEDLTPAGLQGPTPLPPNRAGHRLVDEEGVELESFDHPRGRFPSSLPVIRISSISDSPEAKQSGLQSGLRVLKALRAGGVESFALAGLDMEVHGAQSGRQGGRQGGWNDIRFQYHGIALRLGPAGPEEQIRRFLFLEPELQAKAHQISEVDLRFPGRLIVRSNMGFVGATRRVAQIKGEAAPRPYPEGR